MKTFATIVVAVLTLSIASNASALGKREEGALIGIFGTLLIQSVAEARDQRNQHNQPMSYPTGSHGEFPAFRCQGSEVTCAYERGVWERKKEEWEDAKKDAYLCGRYGRNCN